MRLLGHPVHPMLVHFPVALWTIATIAYGADAFGLSEAAAAIARLGNAAGVIMAVPAMAAGLLELRSIEVASAAMRVATWHLMVMATAFVCFLFALVLPMSSDAAMSASTARAAGMVAAVLGFLLMSAGGWLGGRLVYEFGIGVRAR